MATHNAISAVSQALLNVLRSADPPSDFGSLQFEHYHANDFEHPMVNGYSLFLWRVSTNQNRRNLPPRRLSDGRIYRSSLPLDLHYLLTPWATQAETQQRLLGWAMRVIEDVAILPAGALNYGLSETDTFASNEAVEILCDPLPFNDQFNLWDKLKTKMQLSMTYQARGILVDSQQPLPDYGLVQSRTFQAPDRTA